MGRKRSRLGRCTTFPSLADATQKALWPAAAHLFRLKPREQALHQEPCCVTASQQCGLQFLALIEPAHLLPAHRRRPEKQCGPPVATR
eukprot:scaffold34982_cov27-Tisochrysis_lutea.AAC.6